MRELIDDPLCVDAEWLTYVLQHEGHLQSGKVIAVTKTPLGNSIGFLSRVVRLSPEYQGNADGLPDSFILKAHTVIPNFLGVAEELKAFDRELGFYQEFRQKVCSRLPKFYGGYSQAGRGWLLLEDLSSIPPGDQVAGLSNLQVAKTIENIAAIHALCWQSEELNRAKWLPIDDFWFRTEIERSWRTLKQSYCLRIGSEGCELIDSFVACHGDLFGRLSSRPRTLIHGDLRADNLLMDSNPKSRDDVIILDWQTATQSMGAIDIAFLIAGSEPTAERHGRIHSLVRTWHTALVENGVKSYSYDEAYLDVRAALLLCLAVPIKAFEELGGPNFRNVREVQLAELMIFRYVQAALDLNVGELLESWDF
ncbi:phosphotransferase [Synechococcus sp. RS9916]|uniref:phosphotransferase n=1 Tax=Synechococcus sp. RS9916 TaxID=221359 RepID=UPI0000E53418|nr:phosphotransferase [Synechococcus sp. RS9916]EAU74844.1 hypothetical protein RS9916_35092 [Synechococcus sp. RS9916]